MAEKRSQQRQDDRVGRAQSIFLAHMQQADNPDADALIAAHPELETEIRQQFRRMQLINRAGDKSDGSELQSQDGYAGRPRFEPLRRHWQCTNISVFDAQDAGTDSIVRLYCIPRRILDDPTAWHRFEHHWLTLEAMADRRICLPPEVETTDHLRCHVEDRTASRSLQEHAHRNNLSIKEVLSFFLQHATVVHEAHRRGVVHGRLLSDSLRIDTDDDPRVHDFALGLLAPDDWHDLTAPESERATVHAGAFASPEQVVAGAGFANTACDIYALGVILFRTLTGKFPYFVLGNWNDLAENILHTAPATARSIRKDVPRKLDGLVAACLEKQPEMRPASVVEVIRTLRAIVGA